MLVQRAGARPLLGSQRFMPTPWETVHGVRGVSRESCEALGGASATGGV